jgi:hypothetical protein
MTWLAGRPRFLGVGRCASELTIFIVRCESIFAAGQRTESGGDEHLQGEVEGADADDVVGQAQHPPHLDELIESAATLGVEALAGVAVVVGEVDVEHDLERAPQRTGSSRTE